MRLSLAGGPALMEVEGIGPVLFERSSRARRINITIEPFRGIRVAVPRGVSIGTATDAVLLRAEWIRRHRLRMSAEIEESSPLLERAGGMDAKAARNELVERLAVLAGTHGFFYDRVFVRRQRTLWGSCSARNNINLNMKLAALPAELSDYVMMHELVHTRIKNHGPRFWAELVRLVPGARTLDKELKRYRLLLA